MPIVDVSYLVAVGDGLPIQKRLLALHFWRKQVLRFIGWSLLAATTILGLYSLLWLILCVIVMTLTFSVKWVDYFIARNLSPLLL